MSGYIEITFEGCGKQSNSTFYKSVNTRTRIFKTVKISNLLV